VSWRSHSAKGDWGGMGSPGRGWEDRDGDKVPDCYFSMANLIGGGRRMGKKQLKAFGRNATYGVTQNRKEQDWTFGNTRREGGKKLLKGLLKKGIILFLYGTHSSEGLEGVLKRIEIELWKGSLCSGVVGRGGKKCRGWVIVFSWGGPVEVSRR